MRAYYVLGIQLRSGGKKRNSILTELTIWWEVT